MRKVVYGGAMSLDGFIAGPGGEYDWIVMDPDIDFAGQMARFDTFLIGRKTFDVMRRMGNIRASKGITNIVFSRTLNPADCPHAVLRDDAVSTVADLRKQPGKDIALFGGGELFRSLLAGGLVDEVGVCVIPVLLGGGVPLLAVPADRARLALKKHQVYEKTGCVGLEYEIVKTSATSRSDPLGRRAASARTPRSGRPLR
jgi:dihydrofolate reductase